MTTTTLMPMAPVMPAPLVRPATARDVPALAAMGARLAQLHHEFDASRFFYEDSLEAGYRSWFARELKRDSVCFRVVDVDGTVAASAGGGIAGYVYGNLEERDWNKLLDEHAALIDIYVRPDQRRRGVGVALGRAFCAWADEKQAPRVVLSTAAKNIEAQALFAALGFRSTMIEMTRDAGQDEG